MAQQQKPSKGPSPGQRASNMLNEAARTQLSHLFGNSTFWRPVVYKWEPDTKATNRQQYFAMKLLKWHDNHYKTWPGLPVSCQFCVMGQQMSAFVNRRLHTFEPQWMEK